MNAESIQDLHRALDADRHLADLEATVTAQAAEVARLARLVADADMRAAVLRRDVQAANGERDEYATEVGRLRPLAVEALNGWARSANARHATSCRDGHRAEQCPAMDPRITEIREALQ